MCHFFIVSVDVSDFIDINIDSHCCLPEVMRALVRKPNLNVLKVTIENQLILDGALFSTVNTIELRSSVDVEI